MKIFFTLFFVLMYSAALSLDLHAQPSGPPKSTKQSRTLVNVPVVVSDREGRRIPGLKKEDFSVFQGSIKQNINSFSTEGEPVSVALLIDTSGSTQDVLNKIRNAAKDFVEQLTPNDQCLIATFDSKINILTGFTSDQSAMKKSLDKIRTAERDGSIMYDALSQVALNSFQKLSGRKAIVLLSDGKDFGSAVTRKDLISEIEETDVSIYAIQYDGGTGFNKPVLTASGAVEEGKKESKPEKPKKPKKRKDVYTIMIPSQGDTFDTEEVKLIDKVTTTEAVSALNEMSDITAGRLYLSDDAKLSSVFKQVAAELKQQYSLGIYVDGAATEDVLQNIIVKVSRPDVVVQTRTKLRLK